MKLKYNIGKLTTFKNDCFTYDFYDINSEDDLKAFMDELNYNKNIFVFGGGSNILFVKDFYEDKTFVRFFKRGIKKLDSFIFEVSAGENLNYFINYLDKQNINSLNPLFGLPGTVGGAVVGNAGSFSVEIGNFVEEIVILNIEKRKIEKIGKKHLSFSYRSSNLKKYKNIMLLSVIFNFENLNNIKSFKDKYRYVKRRVENQPHGNTCGSYFKNIYINNISEESLEKIKNSLNNPDDFVMLNKFIEKGIIPAGWIIDKANLKGLDIGGVKISEKHANFLINYNNVSGEKIYKLGNLIKELVFNKFNIILKEEVVIVK